MENYEYSFKLLYKQVDKPMTLNDTGYFLDDGIWSDSVFWGLIFTVLGGIGAVVAYFSRNRIWTSVVKMWGECLFISSVL